MSMTENARIRVGTCPHCKCRVRLQRRPLKPKNERRPASVTACENCFSVFQNSKVKSFLTPHREHYGY